MVRAMHKLVTILLVAVMATLLAAGPVIAGEQTPLGGGPDNPMSPCGEWMELGVKAKHYYGFHEEGDGEKIEVRMEVVPHYGATFEIWSKDEVKLWAAEEKFNPIGRGSFSCDCKPEDEVGKMVWLGNFTSAGDYFVVVKQRGAQLGYYKLSINGKEVSFPFASAETMAPAPAAPAAAAAAPAAARAAATMAEGTSPSLAMAPMRDWTSIAAHGTQWYKFSYVADRGIDGDEDPPQVTIRMDLDHPRDDVQFDVWTQEQVNRLIAEGEDITGKDEVKGFCVGAGAENEDVNKDEFVWSGNFMKSGTYYVRVQHTFCEAKPANYQLEITGDSVSF